VKAAVLNQIPGQLEIEDITIDKPTANEVLVQVVNAGLCHSDLHFMDAAWQTQLPAVLGHESAGIVQAVGEDVSYVSVGDHVITCLSVFCGNCDLCLTGRPNLCRNNAAVSRGRGETARLTKPDGTEVQQFARLGGFAEEMLVHQNAVVKIRPDMPLDRAALIGCGVTTGVGAVFKTAKIEPGSTVAVFGAGGIGLSAVQGARIAGAGRIISIDVTADKLETARSVGATDTINGSEVDAVAAIHEMTGGGVDYAFECIGLKATCEQAWSASKLGGTTVIVGMMPLGEKIEIPGHEVFMMEKRLQGSMMGSNSFRVDMPRYIDMYLDGRLMLDEMISSHIHLDQINEGYDQMRQRIGTRTVIDFT
jgi:S-(hydroxymethyl)glutathione dehydrogenase/alcohol dehydrogenase